MSFTAMNGESKPKAVIVAAGMSMRMRPLTNDTPKCLLEVGGKPVIVRAIENILASGVEEVAVVLGFQSDKLRGFLKQRFPSNRIRFCVNPKYESTNNAFSLLMAREYFTADARRNAPLRPMLLLDSDIVFPASLLVSLLAKRDANRIAVRVAGTHNEEEIGVSVNRHGNIITIGKHIPVHSSFGESIGIEYFTPETAGRLFEVLEERVRTGSGRTEFYEASFQQLVEEGELLEAVDVSEYPSIEIDTPEDLLTAEQLIHSLA